MSIFRRLFQEKPGISAARSLYGEIVAQARQPAFYTHMAVPDTLDGRFDLITLHAILVMDRLGATGETAFSQTLFDEMFTALDHNLREMGVGDLSVPKRIKVMAEAFYGRAGAYRTAMKEAGNDALAAALARNIWPQTDIAREAPAALAAYMRRVAEALAGQEIATLRTGHVRFPEV